MYSHNVSRSTFAFRPWAFTRLVARLFTGGSRASCPRAKLTPSEFGGTMTSASTSLGEASARIQATDLERRKTPRVRTAPPGLRVEPKWLPEIPGYAVQCQSSGERGALRPFASGNAPLFDLRVGVRAEEVGPTYTSEIDDRLVPIRDRSDFAN